jgi:hypothetical protein
MKSFIKHGERGFWVNDSIMQFVFAYLYCRFTVDDVFKEKSSFMELIKDNSLGYFASYMHLSLETELNENERREFCLKIFIIVLELNNDEAQEIQLYDLCNYEEYKSIEYYLPKEIDKNTLIRYLLKLAYLCENYLRS